MTIRRHLIGGPILGGARWSIPSLRDLSALMVLLPISLLLQSCGSAVGSTDHSGVLNEVAQFSAPYDVGSLVFSPDNNQLAVNTLFEGTDVEIWDWQESRVVMRLSYGGGPGDGKGLAYSKDGDLIAACHGLTRPNDVVRVWNARNGKLVTELPESPSGFYGPIAFVGKQNFLVRVTPHPLDEKGDQLIADDSRSWKKVWGIQMDHFLPNFLAAPWRGANVAVEGFTTHSKPNLIDADAESDIYIIDGETGRVERILRHPFSVYYGVESFAESPDGEQLAVGFHTGDRSTSPYAVAIFDGVTGKQLFAIPAKTAQLTRGLAYTPDGRFLVVADVDETVRVVDVQRMQVVQTIPIRAAVVGVSPNSQYVALAFQQQISVWRFNKQ